MTGQTDINGDVDPHQGTVKTGLEWGCFLPLMNGQTVIDGVFDPTKDHTHVLHLS
ncbi:hypothetical protein PGT21_018661 [Puccinia graminis f. sp. tritici]|uniref:Uncharacterized protein n=1 Tax=Puccinia graminis f. sp. tritici TaxID=56615 RepID=A0A5B0MDK2_PUCGR|nr:hypothetical protein PGT21_018661 [Puccinia graminis f. sp. tritici]